MVDAETLRTKCREIEAFLKRIESVGPINLDSFKGNRDAQDIILFSLLQAAQACIDIAAHVISDEGWEMHDEYKLLFLVLSQNRVISSDLCQFMQEFTGFRNVLVHRYGFLSHEKAYRFYLERHRLAEFCGAVLRHFKVLE